MLIDKETQKLIRSDYYRYYGKDIASIRLYFKAFRTRHEIRFMFWWRVIQNIKNPILKKIIYRRMNVIMRRTGIEIPSTVKIGAGFQMTHPYNITINSAAVLGENVTMLKGATVGNVKDGRYIGTPTIGNNVYIGLNSSVVGGITIGDDVLIAANTFVNRNVPSHSLVFGSPCIIKSVENGITKEYVSNAVSDEL